MTDYYDVLQITPAATFGQVQKAYRTLALQYHPDRNIAPEAGPRMAAINEAYSVLGDPERRRVYDRERIVARSADLAGPVLRAAYDALLKSGWTVAKATDTLLILEQGVRSARVSFAARADNALLRKLERQSTGFQVIMAAEIETPFNLSLMTAVIDLMHSRHYGAPFPDAIYQSLFAGFL